MFKIFREHSIIESFVTIIVSIKYLPKEIKRNPEKNTQNDKIAKNVAHSV
jgi:hypothetical protein